MASNSPDRPNRRGAGWRLLRRLLLAAACGFGVLFVALAVLIVPDQVRPIAEPKIGIEVLRSGRMDGAVLRALGNVSRDAKSQADRMTTTRDQADPSSEDEPTSGTPESQAAPSHRPDGGIEDLVLADLRNRLEPFPSLNERPDLYEVPEHLHSTAEEYNRAMGDAATSFVAVVKASEAMSLEEAKAALDEFYNRLCGLNHEYFVRFEGYYGKLHSLVRHGAEMRKAYLRAAFKIRFDHGDWRGAAGESMMLAGWPVPDKKSRWWQYEVYCFRRSGLKGRWALALHSTGPAVFPLVRILTRGTRLEEQILLYEMAETLQDPQHWLVHEKPKYDRRQ